MHKITNRQYKRIKRHFEEKAEWHRKRAQKVSHRSGEDRRQKFSLVEMMSSRVDQMLIVASFVSPPLKIGLIDRFLVIAERERIKPVIVFNKVDLADNQTQVKEVENIYRTIGYQVMKTSARTREGIDRITDILNSKKSILAGHSGVGKSSLLRLILPSGADKPETRQVSDYSNKGQHATTAVKLYRIDSQTTIFDMPGLKLANIYDVDKIALQKYFREFGNYSMFCRFHDCIHINEPECAVKDAVDRGLIVSSRYGSYLKILQNPFAAD
ncbi:MAG: ribosome small subunit-dependent GTPase A [Vulcanimicrobiota bacterium]